MRNLVTTLKTKYPYIWEQFEDYLEESYPNQQVVLRLEIFSFNVQIALISGFLLSRKLQLQRANFIKSDWAYFHKKFNDKKMIYVNHKSGFVCQKEVAERVTTHIFSALNNQLQLQAA